MVGDQVPDLAAGDLGPGGPARRRPRRRAARRRWTGSCVPPDLVCVLAVDMPRVPAGTVARLTWAVEADPQTVDGAVLVDADGRRQPLAAVYRRAALRGRPAARVAGSTGCRCAGWSAGSGWLEVPAVGDEARDVDTWADLRRPGG